MSWIQKNQVGKAFQDLFWIGFLPKNQNKLNEGFAVTDATEKTIKDQLVTLPKV